MDIRHGVPTRTIKNCLNKMKIFNSNQGAYVRQKADTHLGKSNRNHQTAEYKSLAVGILSNSPSMLLLTRLTISNQFRCCLLFHKYSWRICTRTIPVYAPLSSWSFDFSNHFYVPTPLIFIWMGDVTFVSTWPGSFSCAGTSLDNF
jgi:hypothetical protein